jgi:hypothetical protein
MSPTRAAIASWWRILLLLTLVLAGVMLVRGHVSGIPPFDHLGDALQRLALVAASDTAQLKLLVLVCLALGILVMLDRRRRTGVRRSSS